MASLSKIISKPIEKKPISTGAKLAIIVGGIVLFVATVVVIAGIFFAGPALSFLKNGSIKVDEKNGSVEVTTQDGQSTFSSKAELPDNYPADIPRYPGAEIVYSVVKASDGSNVTWRTNDSLQQVTAYYEEHLASQGWAKTQGQQAYFTAGIGFAEKPSRNLSVIVTNDNKDGKESTVIVVTEKTGQ